MAGDWTKQEDISSARVRRAIAFGDTLADVVNGKNEEGFDAMLPLIDAERFRRRGNERDYEMDWPTYRGMCEQWKGTNGLYEKELFRATEAGNVVYLDLNERSVSPEGEESTLRSISIYHFDDADRIYGVDVCMGFHHPQAWGRES